MVPVKILMVCLGNICRSPLAQGILESKIDSSKYTVDSAGTAAYHTGNSPDPRSIAIANQHGISIQNQKARQFSIFDFQKFHYIYVMDKTNYRDIISLASSEDEKRKVKLILDNEMEVPDPYYGGNNGFENVYQLLDEACQIIANKIEE